MKEVRILSEIVKLFRQKLSRTNETMLEAMKRCNLFISMARHVIVIPRHEDINVIPEHNYSFVSVANRENID